MSLLTEVKGWTPVIDAMTTEFGLVTAAVYGVVWRYCQMDDRVCRASLEVIGDHLNLNKATVMRHIKILCDNGYLKDLTPDRRNAPHVYADAGKVKIRGLIEVTPALESHTKRGQTVAENNSYINEEAQTVAHNNSSISQNGQTVAQRNATVAHSNATVAESKLKKDSKRLSKKVNTITTTEVEQASRAMFSALVTLCQYDPDMLTKETRGALNRAEKELRDKGYTPADLEAFGIWWDDNDWRGKQGQPPTLKQMRDTWGQFKSGKRGQQNGHNHTGTNRTNISGLREKGTDNPIKKRFNPATGETYYVDINTGQRVPEPANLP